MGALFPKSKVGGKMSSLNIKLYRKFTKIADKYLVHCRKKQLNNTDFSIISNNCWGGYVYRRYGLPYLTPTVGLYFFANDFIKLCYNVRHYMNTPLVFISYKESRYREFLEKRGQQNIPIGKLDDIEVVFLHYKTEKEAREKWERRAKRINYNNLIFKFSKMNECTQENLEQFDSLTCDKKICFVPPKEKSISCGISFESARNSSEIIDDTSEYARYINIKRVINAQHVNGKKID